MKYSLLAWCYNNSMRKTKINSSEFAKRLGRPISTLVEVSKLIKRGCLVEIEVIAAVNK